MSAAETLPPRGRSRSRMLAWAAVLVACDQAAKWATHSKVTGGMELGWRWLRIAPSQNPGGLFGLFEGQRVLLTAVSGAVLFALLVWAWRGAGKSRLVDVGLSLAIAGAAGNLADRLVLGYVRDFIHVGPWPAFNVADALITIAVGVFLLAAIGRGRPRGGQGCI